MEKSTARTLKLLGAAYEKHLLGTPLDKLGLTYDQSEAIQQFEKFGCDGRTAVQISTASSGVISGDVAAVLRRVKREFRNRVKVMKLKPESRDARRILSTRPEYSKFIDKKKSPTAPRLTLPEVFSHRLMGYSMKDVISHGGQVWQFTRSGVVVRLIERGNLDAAEIAAAVKVTLQDVRKCLKIYKEWNEKIKIKLAV